MLRWRQCTGFALGRDRDNRLFPLGYRPLVCISQAAFCTPDAYQILQLDRRIGRVRRRVVDIFAK